MAGTAWLLSVMAPNPSWVCPTFQKWHFGEVIHLNDDDLSYKKILTGVEKKVPCIFSLCPYCISPPCNHNSNHAMLCRFTPSFNDDKHVCILQVLSCTTRRHNNHFALLVSACTVICAWYQVITHTKTNSRSKCWLTGNQLRKSSVLFSATPLTSFLEINDISAWK